MGSLPARIGARAVAIDPQHPKRVYAVGESGVVYRSNDAGQTWAAVDQGLPDGKIAALALDLVHPERLYAATASEALYISEDGAQSWRALRHTGGMAYRRCYHGVDRSGGVGHGDRHGLQPDRGPEHSAFCAPSQTATP